MRSRMSSKTSVQRIKARCVLFSQRKWYLWRLTSNAISSIPSEYCSRPMSSPQCFCSEFALNLCCEMDRRAKNQSVSGFISYQSHCNMNTWLSYQRRSSRSHGSWWRGPNKPASQFHCIWNILSWSRAETTWAATEDKRAIWVSVVDDVSSVGFVSELKGISYTRGMFLQFASGRECLTCRIQSDFR